MVLCAPLMYKRKKQALMVYCIFNMKSYTTWIQSFYFWLILVNYQKTVSSVKNFGISKWTMQILCEVIVNNEMTKLPMNFWQTHISKWLLHELINMTDITIQKFILSILNESRHGKYSYIFRTLYHHERANFIRHDIIRLFSELPLDDKIYMAEFNFKSLEPVILIPFKYYDY